ncbi:MAG: GDSL-type esterase/lipase family protein [Vicinamibacteria bacterium]
MSSRGRLSEISFSTRKTVLYSVLLTTIGLGLIECLARLTQPGLRELPRFLVRSIDTDIELPFMEPDPEVFWKPTPGFSGAMWDGHVTIGADGLRENGAGRGRAPKRILCFGDSITFGFGVSDDETYPAALSALLEPHGIEVRNAGVTGFTSYQAVRWLRRQLRRQHVDDVTLLVGWNDLTRRPITDVEFGARLDSSAGTADATLKHLAIYRLMKATWLRRGLQSNDGKLSRPTVRVPLKDYADNLEVFVNEARAAGARPHFIALPSRRFPGKEAARTDYADILAAVAQRLSVPLHEVGILSSSNREIAATGNASYFIDSLHMSPEGNRLMASLLARDLGPGNR